MLWANSEKACLVEDLAHFDNLTQQKPLSSLAREGGTAFDHSDYGSMTCAFKNKERHHQSLGKWK